MISPYLKRPLRALDEILSEAAAEGQPGTSAVPPVSRVDVAPERDGPARRTNEPAIAGR